MLRRWRGTVNLSAGAGTRVEQMRRLEEALRDVGRSARELNAAFRRCRRDAPPKRVLTI